MLLHLLLILLVRMEKRIVYLLHYNNVDCYICTYEYTPTMVKTVISYLMGEFEAHGKLPIELQ